MLEKTFKIETEDGVVTLSSEIAIGDGTTSVLLSMKCPEKEFTLSVFEAQKLAKGILDTIDFGSML